MKPKKKFNRVWSSLDPSVPIQQRLYEHWRDLGRRDARTTFIRALLLDGYVRYLAHQDPIEPPAVPPSRPENYLYLTAMATNSVRRQGGSDSTSTAAREASSAQRRLSESESLSSVTTGTSDTADELEAEMKALLRSQMGRASDTS